MATLSGLSAELVAIRSFNVRQLDYKNLTLDRFHVTSAGKEPLIVLHDVEGATIRNSVPPSKAVRFVEEMGKTSHVTISNSL